MNTTKSIKYFFIFIGLNKTYMSGINEIIPLLSKVVASFSIGEIAKNITGNIHMVMS
jgi:hypothetical protein